MAVNPFRPIIPDIFFPILSEIASAWISGKAVVRSSISIAIFAASVSFILLILVKNDIIIRQWLVLSTISGAVSAALLIAVVVYRSAIGNVVVAAQIEAVEQRVRDHPELPIAAWDLARLKLESYLNHNLQQISWIYFLVLIIMTVGSILIIGGIWHSYRNPENISTLLIGASAGIIVQFVGATFLLIYKSTMAQAHDYVAVLERINAVGMSIQILESIEGEDSKMRNEVRSQLARDLLQMYGITSK